MSLRDRLVERDAGYATPCLEWAGACNDRGYGQVRIAGRTRYVHRLVWAEAHGDPGPAHVLHHCDNPPCARLDHLFLGTQGDNMRDAMVKGRMPQATPANAARAALARRAHHFARGEAHGQHRLTVEQVLDIRARDGTYASLARQYGVTPATIRNIVNRKTWRHV